MCALVKSQNSNLRAYKASKFKFAPLKHLKIQTQYLKTLIVQIYTYLQAKTEKCGLNWNLAPPHCTIPDQIVEQTKLVKDMEEVL